MDIRIQKFSPLKLPDSRQQFSLQNLFLLSHLHIPLRAGLDFSRQMLSIHWVQERALDDQLEAGEST
jgi:hypothetical protein